MTVNISSLQERTSPSLEADSELATQEYFVNMGPQHPSTHGVLRLILKLDGERVKEVIPVLGYIHRSIEKMGEFLSYRQFVHLTDRMDYLSSIANNWGVSKAVEKAAGIESNDRIETIRTIMAELQRIQSHQLWWGVLGMDLGAFTPFLYGWRDREQITDIIEETTGSRLTLNYVQPGGVMFDIHANFVGRVKKFIKEFKSTLVEYEDLLSGNIIIQERLCDIGTLDAETAINLGTTGPVLRASNVPHDLRKTEPYGVYDKVEFDIAIGSKGDSWDRYCVRLEEMRQSLKIIEQLIDNIPEGKHMTMKHMAKIKIPPGVYYDHIETARGVLGTMIVSDEKDSPYRIHMRSPCFNNLWAIVETGPGCLVGDLVSILSTLDLVIPDIDR